MSLDRFRRGISVAHVAIRMCVGCRQRATVDQLLRVALHPGERSDDRNLTVTVLADPRRRVLGRGAWVHPDPACVALADRRRAFGRALKSSAPVNSAQVAGYVETLARPPSSRPQPSGR
jgi:predicted RNA-binding protein YlxR (DUF448 family)